MKIRTKASICLRHVGHVLILLLHAKQTVKWPQGIQANRLSSLKQAIQGLFSAKFLVESFSDVVESVWAVVLLGLAFVGTTGLDWFGDTSVLLLLFIGCDVDDDTVCGPSRNRRIWTLGTFILSLFPWMQSICLCKISHAMNKSLSLTKSSSKINK